MSCSLPPNPFSDDQKARVCGVLSVGCDRQTAVSLLGRSLADLRRAMEADARFAAEVCRAEAGAELAHMRNIQQAAQDVKNWRASVWWLERHAPERFGARTPGAVTPRQLKAFLEILARAVREHVQNPDDCGKLLAQLRALADSVDQMLRDGQASLDTWETTPAIETVAGGSDTALLCIPTPDNASFDNGSV